MLKINLVGRDKKDRLMLHWTDIYLAKWKLVIAVGIWREIWAQRACMGHHVLGFPSHWLRGGFLQTRQIDVD